MELNLTFIGTIDKLNNLLDRITVDTSAIITIFIIIIIIFIYDIYICI